MNKRDVMQPTLRRVTQSYPSPVISCIHKAPHSAEVSRITSQSSENRRKKSLNEESTKSNVLKDVHIVRFGILHIVGLSGLIPGRHNWCR